MIRCVQRDEYYGKQQTSTWTPVIPPHGNTPSVSSHTEYVWPVRLTGYVEEMTSDFQGQVIKDIAAPGYLLDCLFWGEPVAMWERSMWEETEASCQESHHKGDT